MTLRATFIASCRLRSTSDRMSLLAPRSRMVHALGSWHSTRNVKYLHTHTHSRQATQQQKKGEVPAHTQICQATKERRGTCTHTHRHCPQATLAVWLDFNILSSAQGQATTMFSVKVKQAKCCVFSSWSAERFSSQWISVEWKFLNIIPTPYHKDTITPITSTQKGTYNTTKPVLKNTSICGDHSWHSLHKITALKDRKVRCDTDLNRSPSAYSPGKPCTQANLLTRGKKWSPTSISKKTTKI